MEPLDIKAELKRKNITLTSIGRKFNPHKSPQAVDRVIQRKSTSKQIQEAIAEELKPKFTYERIWGEAA
jgi:IS30 family transposase